MADSNRTKDKDAKKKGGGRTTALAALLAVVAVIAAWLSNCIPGFGIGASGSAEGEAEKSEQVEKAEPEPQKEVEKVEDEPAEPAAGEVEAKTLSVKITVHGCSVGGGQALECEALCEQAELFDGIDDAILEVEGAPHGAVLAVTDCLKTKSIDKIAIRRE